MDRAIARRYVTGIIFYRVGKSIISRCRNIKLAGNRDIAGHVAIMIVNGAYANIVLNERSPALALMVSNPFMDGAAISDTTTVARIF